MITVLVQVFMGPPHYAAARLRRGMTMKRGAFVFFVFFVVPNPPYTRLGIRTCISS